MTSDEISIGGNIVSSFRQVISSNVSNGINMTLPSISQYYPGIIDIRPMFDVYATM